MASRPLEEVPDGIRIFVDTNILIYHLLDDDLYGASCRDFLQRVEAQSVTAFTSPIVAAEMLSGDMGIGFFAWDSYNAGSYDKMVAAVIFIGFIGLVIDRVFDFVMKRVQYS